ncbi:MAG TPA: hypothetical protein VK909_07900 [Anaerolineales bacterium]|nr:hypothetical protein [Anaerolineales bacterium]
MKSRGTLPLLIVAGLLMMSCLLPGMISPKSTPTGPMPAMETDANKVITVLSGKDWQYLGALAKEQYSEEDFAKPGTLKYTVTITNNQPIYFNYGWCAKDETILKQNFEHIQVKLYINGEELGKDVVQQLSYTSQDNMACLDHGVLTSDWPEGTYDLKAVATFDEKINDGIADYEPGDYIFEYKVTVNKQKEGA